MHQLYALLVVAALLLIPLGPAAILYLVLTPKNSQGEQKAEGEVGAGDVTIGGFRVHFNVVGSTATYVVLLAVASYIYSDVLKDAEKRDSIRDLQAWLVEVPVGLKNSAGQPLPANNGELQQVRVELEPALTRATANLVQFWVVPNNGKFPSARFSITNIGVNAQVLDLNDSSRVEHEYTGHKMTGIAPVWMELGSAYADTLHAPPPP